jgi:hypothetical protein
MKFPGIVFLTIASVAAILEGCSQFKRRYREQHPDYVRRNAAFVRKWRLRLRSTPVSPTSPDLHVTIESERTSLRIAQVSHTSCDIFVTLFPA